MKKIFTLLLCSALFAGSCWGTGTEITIGGTSTTTKYSPDNSYYNCYVSQMLYLKSDMGSATAGNITSISFYVSASPACTRKFEVYLSNSSSTKLNGLTSVSSSSLVFDGSISVPSSGWYTINFTNNFAWNGTNNILVTINDKTKGYSGSSADVISYYAFTKTNAMVAYNSKISGDPYNATSMSGGNTSNICPTIKFTIEAASTPSITTPANVNLGTFARKECVSNTFSLSGSNLTADVNISASDGLSVSPSSIDAATLNSGAQTITVSSNTSFAFQANPKVTITSSISEFTTAYVSVQATEQIEFTEQSTVNFLKNAGANSYNILTANATINSIDGQTMEISYNGTITVDFSAVGGSYTEFGKVTNVKGKLISSELFKAFSFDYTAPIGITIDEDSDNSEVLTQYDGETVTVHLKRSFIADMYNTICLPMTISKSEINGKFGANCSVIELSSSSLTGDAIELGFTEVLTELEAGNPYLIKPENKVENPSFTNVKVNKDVATTTTDYVDFIPLLSPTALPQSKEILFMGQNNELFWPTEAGTLKGLRCYFQVKNTAVSGAPVRMVINKDNTVTNIVDVNANANVNRKVMLNGQLIIIRDGVKFNAQGSRL